MRTTEGADPRSLISVFVVRCLDSIKYLVSVYAIYKVQSGYRIWLYQFLIVAQVIFLLFKTLASLYSWAGRFESYLVANLEDRFSRDEAQIIYYLEATLWLLYDIIRVAQIE